MGRNVFVSYKYGDTKVRSLNDIKGRPTRVRDYVNLLQEEFDDISDFYWYAEDDEESLENKDADYIKRALTDFIYPTSVTLIFASKGMKVAGEEKLQWIPWEVSYSLKEISRKGRTSQINGLLLVVLPDENNDYGYFVNQGDCGVQKLSYSHLFRIIEDNFHNKRDMHSNECNKCGSSHYSRKDSYIVWARWDDFIKSGNVEKFIEEAGQRGEDSEKYIVLKEVK